jgi:hypothetical protein
MFQLAGLWIDATGRALLIAHRSGGSYSVSVAPSVSDDWYPRSLLCGRATTHGMPATFAGAKLVVEAGEQGLGPTWELTPGGEELVPCVRMGLYDDFDDDLGVPWAFPLSRFRRASDEERRQFARARPP